MVYLPANFQPTTHRIAKVMANILYRPATAPGPENFKIFKNVKLSCQIVYPGKWPCKSLARGVTKNTPKSATPTFFFAPPWGRHGARDYIKTILLIKRMCKKKRSPPSPKHSIPELILSLGNVDAAAAVDNAPPKKVPLPPTLWAKKIIFIDTGPNIRFFSILGQKIDFFSILGRKSIFFFKRRQRRQKTSQRK